jgi:hypothetical protein
MAPSSNSYCSFIAKATASAPATLLPMRASKGPSMLVKHHDNILSSQKTLLRLHHHPGFQTFIDIQTWVVEGPFNLSIEVSQCSIPTCLACAFGTGKK